MTPGRGSGEGQKLARSSCPDSVEESGMRSVSPVVGWLVAGFLCLGAFFRFYNFWSPDLWLDEYGTWWIIAAGDWSALARRAISYGTQSPFYYLTVKISTDVLGIGTFSLRLPPILCGIATVGLAYPLGRRIFRDRHAALVALAAFAVNPWLIRYSQEARPYALAVLCRMLSFFFYICLLQTERVTHRIGYLLATAAAYYAHFLFGVVLVVQMLHLSIRRGWTWLASREWAGTFLLLALFCLPGVPQVASLFGRRQSLDWAGPYRWVYPLKMATESWLFLVVALVVLVVRFWTREKFSAQDRPAMDLILLWLLVPLVWFAVVPPLLGVTLFTARYVLSAAPAALFLLAWLMASVGRAGWLKWIPLAVFLTLTFRWGLMPPLQATGTFSKHPRGGWAQAAESLERFAAPDDLILLRSGFIEADRVRGPDTDPLLESAVNWPLIAHLSSPRAHRIVSLPYQTANQTRPYLSTLIKVAAEQHRVWVIGTAAMVTEVARTLVADSHFHVEKQISYGGVQVILLEQSLNQSGEQQESRVLEPLI